MLNLGRLKSEIAPALKYLSNGLMASKSQIIELDLSDNAFGPNGIVGITDLLASNTCHTLEVSIVLKKFLTIDGFIGTANEQPGSWA